MHQTKPRSRREGTPYEHSIINASTTHCAIRMCEYVMNEAPGLVHSQRVYFRGAFFLGQFRIMLCFVRKVKECFAADSIQAQVVRSAVVVVVAAIKNTSGDAQLF